MSDSTFGEAGIITISNAAVPVAGSCGILAAAEPFYHADRVADFNVMIYVFDGTIHVTEELPAPGGTQQFDYSVRRGELLFLKSGIHHFGKTEIPRGTRWFYVHFTLDEPLPENELTAKLPKYISGLSGSEAEERIRRFAEFYDSRSPLRDWNINLRLAELLGYIALDQARQPTSLPDRIAAYLAANTSQPFSAKAAERELCFSYKYMESVFKKSCGETMQQFHSRLRMEQAGRLLRSTMLPVGEIAAAVGFSDMMYFSRCFHRFSGQSPTEFRRGAARALF